MILIQYGIQAPKYTSDLEGRSLSPDRRQVPLSPPRLLENSYFDQEQPQQGWESRFVRSSLKEKDTLLSNSLLRPFGSQELLFDLQKNLKDFKEQPYD